MAARNVDRYLAALDRARHAGTPFERAAADFKAQYRLFASIQIDAAGFVRAMARMQADMERMAVEFTKQLGRALKRHRRDLVLVVPDPAKRRPRTFRAWRAQAADIIRHDYYMAAGQPERCPGAHYRRASR